MCHTICITLQTLDEIEDFVIRYGNETNETFKVKYSKNKKTSKWTLELKRLYRCHFDTRNESTRDLGTVLQRVLSKRFKNTMCQFQLSFNNLFKDEGYYCSIRLEHNHNYPINSLEAMSF